MRYFYLTVFSFLLFARVQAQSAYDLTFTTETYSDLSNPTVITNTFNTNFYNIVLPPAFRAFGNDMGDTVAIGVGGFLVAGQHNYGFALDPALGDFRKRDANSSLSYTITGPEGAKILKVQWKNIGDSTGKDFLNMQLWVYEENQTIEFRYGPSQVSANSPAWVGDVGPSMGIWLLDEYFGTLYDLVTVGGDASSPMETNDVNTTFTGFPAPNSVFRFSFLHTGMNEKGGESVRVYPVPASNTLYIEGEDQDGSGSILDASGREVKEIDLKTRSIDISDLSNGVYFLQVRKPGEAPLVRKFIINR